MILNLIGVISKAKAGIFADLGVSNHGGIVSFLFLIRFGLRNAKLVTEKRSLNQYAFYDRLYFFHADLFSSLLKLFPCNYRGDKVGRYLVST